jgi:hypothetical protein
MQLKPAIIQNLNSPNYTHQLLSPVSIDTPPYNEEWLQRLIQNNPDLIPASDVEACFSTLVPILMEFGLPSGSLDNFFITPDGYPVLVEVKLWKNQESRRKVVTQILEYAKDFAALTYSDLNTEYSKKNPDSRGKDNPLYDMVAAYAPDTPDEAVFVDRVSRNLREGRFLLLIVGDGIREELAALSEYLLHHSLRYAFGLVQIKLFKLPEDQFLALPSIMAKTQTIERHVTIINVQDNIRVTDKPAEVVSERTEKTSLSTDEFYEHLSRVSPQAATWVKDILSRMQDIPIELSVSHDYASLIAPLSGGESLILSKITIKNKIEFWGIPNKKRKIPAWRDLSKKYLDSVSAAIPGSFVKTFESGHMDVYNANNEKLFPLEAFIGKEEQFVQAMRQVIADAEAFFQKEAA